MRAPAWLARWLHPAVGTCFGCGYPWSHVPPRVVYYNHNSGCFALCVGCWRDRTVAERVEAHERLVTELWEDQSMLPQIRQAVRAASHMEKFANLGNLGTGV